jgi:septal ring factor EnvC (AmiA/AmiB activator)
MRTIITTIFIVAFALILVSPASAQQKRVKQVSSQQQIEMLSAKLNLTPEQQSQVAAIQQHYKNEMVSLNKNVALTSGTKEQKRAEIIAAHYTAFKKTLTKEQRKQLQNMNKK